MYAIRSYYELQETLERGYKEMAQHTAAGHAVATYFSGPAT